MELDPLSHAVKFNGATLPTTPTSLYALTTAGLAYSTNTEATENTTPYSPFTLPHPKPIKPDVKYCPSVNEDVATEESGEAMNTSNVTVKMEPEGEQGSSSNSGSSAEDGKENVSSTNEESEEAVEKVDEDVKMESSFEVDGEPARKKLRKISYHCCICNYTNLHLSELTSHLENEHNLTEYDLIKNLLACLGDIGS